MKLTKEEEMREEYAINAAENAAMNLGCEGPEDMEDMDDPGYNQFQHDLQLENSELPF